MDSSVHVVFHIALPVSDISPLGFLVLGKQRNATACCKLLGYRLSDLQVSFTAMAASCLTGLPCIVTVANIGTVAVLGRGLAKGQLFHCFIMIF